MIKDNIKENTVHNTSFTKATIAAITLGIAVLSLQPVKADAEKLTLPSAQNLTTLNLTTKADYSKLATESAPGWVKVANQNGATDCQEHIFSRQVLCENIQVSTLDQKSAVLN